MTNVVLAAAQPAARRRILASRLRVVAAAFLCLAFLDPGAGEFVAPVAAAQPTEIASAQPGADQLAAKKRRRKRTSRKNSASLGPARVAMVVDAESGEVLYEKNAGRQVSIASLTKLMTVTTFLDLDPDLDDKVRVERVDLAGSGRTQLLAGEVVRIKDLLYHSLMSSDNAATKTLVRVSGLSSEEFLKRMNRKAQVLGLHQTKFVEFTGLAPENVSSASNIAELLRFSLGYKVIEKITSEPDYNYRSNRREHQLVNTNRLVRFSKLEIRGGKTGYINQAGWCLATWVRHQGRDLITVILGAPSNTARFAEVQRVLSNVHSASADARKAEPSLATGS